MKKLIFIFFFCIYQWVNAQIAQLNLINAILGCEGDAPFNEMIVQFNIDTMPGGVCWVEWHHLGSWMIINNSIIFTNPSLHPTLGTGDSAYYTFFLDHVIDSLTEESLYNEDSMYRFRYVDIVTETYVSVDTFFTYCPHFASVEEFENSQIISVERYNLYGQPISEETIGLIIEIYTYSNHKKRAVKKWR